MLAGVWAGALGWRPDYMIRATAQAIWKDYSPTHFSGQTGTYTAIEESLEGVPGRQQCDPATVGEYWCVSGRLAEQRSPEHSACTDAARRARACVRKLSVSAQVPRLDCGLPENVRAALQQHPGAAHL